MTRRQFLPLLGATAILAAEAPRSLAVPLSDPSEKPTKAKARFVYVGTYTAPGVPPGGTHPSTATGIYVFRMNPSNGGLTLLPPVVPASNPSFLALDPALQHLYSVNEETPGRVSAYAVGANRKLTFLNTASANGQNTTHLSVQPSGPYLFAASWQLSSFFGLPLPTARSAT